MEKQKLPEVKTWKKNGIAVSYMYKTDDMVLYANATHAFLEEGMGFPETLKLSEWQETVAQELIDQAAEWMEEHYNQFTPLHEVPLDEIMWLLLDESWDGK